ncbi:MAG: metalloprotease PmbA [Pseudomonadota bacterium]|jgi:PmbA protein
MSQTTRPLEHIAEEILAHAKQLGAHSADADLSLSRGLSVNVRQGDVETIEHTDDSSLSLTVYLSKSGGLSRGNASTADFSSAALRQVAEKALTIARYTEADDCAGLAEASLMCTHFPELDINAPYALGVDEAVDMGKRAEAAGFAVDKRIVNSDGASVASHSTDFVYANSHGFLQRLAGSTHYLGASLLAEDNSGMQAQSEYGYGRHFSDLPTPEWVGKEAARKALGRLNARQLPTGKVSVIFAERTGAGLIGSYVGAVSGGALYRKASFLCDSMGQQVFPAWLHIDEDPFILRGLASGPFDNEGVACQQRRVVGNGKVAAYFLGSYSARKLGLQTTGNAGGQHNLLVSSTGESLAELIKKMHTGLLVTELMGSGVNAITGDYSRGASGFWVENGELAYPVEEITIASNLKDMYQNIQGISHEVDTRGSIRCGSVWVGEMALAGG